MTLPLTATQLHLIQQRHEAAGRIVNDKFGGISMGYRAWEQYREDHQALLDEEDRLSDLLTDCWLTLDVIARGGIDYGEIRRRAEARLRMQNAPGWKAVPQ